MTIGSHLKQLQKHDVIAGSALALMLCLQVTIAAHQHDVEDDLRVHQCLTCVQLHGANHALPSACLWQAPESSFDRPFQPSRVSRRDNRPLVSRSRSPPFQLL